MSTFDEHIDEWISKVLTEEANATELQALGKWIEESEENKKYYDQFKIIFDRSLLSEEKYDENAAWNKVLAQLDGEKGFQHPSSNRTQTWLRIAASIVVLLGIGITLRTFFINGTEVGQLFASAEVISQTLPDGSTITLDQKSSITYEFNKRNGKRSVQLSGQAYFEVKHDEERNFVIDAGGVFIEDIGTAFNVKAYGEDSIISLDVSEGEVRFFMDEEHGLNLKAGQSAEFNKLTKTFVLEDRMDQNILSYKNKNFDFENTELYDVVTKLNEVYGQKIKLEGGVINTCRLTVKFRNESIDTIADIIAATLGLNVRKEGDVIILSGESCQ